MLGTIDSLGIQKDMLGPVAQMRRCGGGRGGRGLRGGHVQILGPVFLAAQMVQFL